MKIKKGIQILKFAIFLEGKSEQKSKLKIKVSSHDIY